MAVGIRRTYVRRRFDLVCQQHPPHTYTTMFLHKRPSPPSTPLEYAVTHVFFPIELPNDNDYTHEYNLSLLRAVCATAHAYTPYLCGTSEEAQWHHITKMLDSLQASVQSERLDKTHVISQLHGMETGGTPTIAV